MTTLSVPPVVMPSMLDGVPKRLLDRRRVGRGGLRQDLPEHQPVDR